MRPNSRLLALQRERPQRPEGHAVRGPGRALAHEDLPVLVKVMSTVLDPPRYFALGINHEDFNHVGSIAGND